MGGLKIFKLTLRRCSRHCMESKLHEIPVEMSEICKPCCSFQSRMEPYQISCSFLQMLWNAYMLRVRDMQTLLFVSVTHGTLSVQLFVSTDAFHDRIYASCARYANLVVRFVLCRRIDVYSFLFSIIVVGIFVRIILKNAGPLI